MTMHPNLENRQLITRRHFFGRTATGVGTAALASLLGKDLSAAARGDSLERPFPGLPALPHFAPKAKRVIWLFQSGGPSQMDLFDYKPQLDRWRGKDLPDSIRKGQRLTGMTSTQDSFPVVNSVFKFNRHGQSGAWMLVALGWSGSPLAPVMVNRPYQYPQPSDLHHRERPDIRSV